MIIFILTIFLIRLPGVQTYITGIITSQLSEQLQTRVEVERVHLQFFDRVQIRGVYVEDQQQDTLVFAGEITANIALFSLFSRNIELQNVNLDNAFINIYKPEGQTKFNYEFILETFATDETPPKEESAWKFELYGINLNNIRLSYGDWQAGMDLDVDAESIEIEIETLGLNENHLIINDIRINELLLAYHQENSRQAAQPDEDRRSPAENGDPFALTIHQLSIDNSMAGYNPVETEGFDRMNFNHMLFDNLHVVLNNITLFDEEISAELASLRFEEVYSGFLFNNLQLDARLTGNALHLQMRALETAHSSFGGTIDVHIPDLQSNNLLPEILINGHFLNDRISMKDAVYFTEALDTLPQILSADLFLKGNLTIKNGNLYLEGFNVSSPRRFNLTTRGHLTNLYDFENASFDITIPHLNVVTGFLMGFIPDALEIPLEIRRTRGITLDGRFTGNLRDINANANVRSSLGNISTNINFRTPHEDRILLNGSIHASDINLARLSGNDSLGLLSTSATFMLNLEGERLRLDTLNMVVHSVELNSYLYKGIVLNGKLVNDILSADILYQDPNLDIDLFAIANLASDLPEFSLQGNFNNVNLLALNLTEDSLQFSTSIHSNLRGLHPDTISGFARLDNTILTRGTSQYRMDSLVFTAYNVNDSIRNISLYTDFMWLTFTGKYSFEELPAAVNNIIGRYNPQFTIDTLHLHTNQYLQARGEIFDDPEILSAYFPGLDLQTPLRFNLDLNTADSLITFTLNAPGIMYGENSIDSIDVRLETEREHINFSLISGIIRSGENISIPSLSFTGSFDLDTLDFHLQLAEMTDTSHFSLDGLTTFSGDTIFLSFQDSEVSIEGRAWNLSDQTLITYAPEFLVIDNFRFHRGSQEIAINTDVLDEVTRLNLLINNVRLGDFIPLLGYESPEIEGTLNANASVTNIFDIDQLQARLNIYDIRINQVPAGNFSLSANKPVHSNLVDLDLNLVNVDALLTTRGNINLDDDDDLLDLRVTLDNFQLDQWATLIDEYLTEVTGTVNADMRIRGSISNPRISGEIHFSDRVSFRPKALGTLYHIPDQRLRLTENEIILNRFTLLDSLNNQAVINGTVRHEAFENMQMDLRFNTSRFRFYNIRRADNPTYYGSVFGAANLSITGPLEQLTISGEIRALEGTDFSLALLDEPAQAATAPYINFIDPAAEEAPPEEEENGLEGINLDLVFGVTSDSRFRIILDPMNGDNIIARGDAELRLRMSPTDDLSIQGTYTVEEGTYSLTLLNIINKTFSVEQGSTLTWLGPPEEVQLDITARYTVDATRYELIEEFTDMMSTAEISAAKRREPVDVFITITGEMLEPEISFRIEVPEQRTGATGSQVARAIDLIHQDEAELLKQSFGIIVMGRFIPPRGGLFAAGTGGGPGEGIQEQLDQSISQLLTQQLNRLTQEYLGGIEISVDVAQRQQLEGGAGITDRDIGIQLSRSFFQDRLRVMVGGVGDLGAGAGGAGAAGLNAPAGIVGEFEVLYRLDDRGNLNIRVFRTHNRNLFIIGILDEITGISISHQRSFDSLDEFFRREGEVLEAPPFPEEIQADPEESETGTEEQPR